MVVLQLLLEVALLTFQPLSHHVVGRAQVNHRSARGILAKRQEFGLYFGSRIAVEEHAL